MSAATTRSSWRRAAATGSKAPLARKDLQALTVPTVLTARKAPLDPRVPLARKDLPALLAPKDLLVPLESQVQLV